MAHRSANPLERQVARVSRRLFLQTLLDRVAWCWAGSIVLAAGWFLLQPLLLQEPPDWLRWAVAGGLAGLGTVLAVALTFWRAPSQLAAALHLDEKFGLRERVTTSLTLAPELVNTPAGQALLADVNQRIGNLDVGSRFPVQVRWPAALVPVCGALLALVVLFYNPIRQDAAQANVDQQAKLPLPDPEREKKMEALKQRLSEKRPPDKPMSEDLKRLEEELEKIVNKPRDSKDQLKERIKEMTSLEDQMKQKEKEMADKAQALKSRLQQMDKAQQKGNKDGPAKDLDKALSEGKLDKAKDEIERLMKKIQNGELTQKEKEKLAEQLKDLQNKLERAADLKEKEEKLKNSNLDPETLKRELERLKEEKKKLDDLKKLADKMGKCQQALKEGDMKAAAEAMSEAAEDMKNLDLNDKDLADLRDQLKRLQDAKDSC